MSHDREKKCLDDRIIVDTSSRPAALWSSIAWRAKASAGASPEQRPSLRCARSSRAMTLISVPTGGSGPLRHELASRLAN
jgi:hypothetical protein